MPSTEKTYHINENQTRKRKYKQMEKEERKILERIAQKEPNKGNSLRELKKVRSSKERDADITAESLLLSFGAFPFRLIITNNKFLDQKRI